MSDRSETFTVEHSMPHLRLDTFLRERYPAVSRGVIQRLIEQGHITVNGQSAKPTHRPHAGDEVRVFFPEAKPAEAKPEDIPLEVLHEDSDLLVINKPSGIVVHPSLGHDEHTLVNALLHHCAGELSGIGGVARPGIVHRLDKETSGCLLVAKNDETHHALSQQFAERSMTKIYQVLVCGVVQRDKGDIRADIARHPTHRKRMAVSPGDGRPSWTAFRVLERLQGASHVEAHLHTGRTHQIRVHFLHIGHPVVGDSTYAARPNKKLEEAIGAKFPRQMLHAWRITFQHPKTSKPVTCTAPLPEDFQTALKTLRG